MIWKNGAYNKKGGLITLLERGSHKVNLPPSFPYRRKQLMHNSSPELSSPPLLPDRNWNFSRQEVCRLIFIFRLNRNSSAGNGRISPLYLENNSLVTTCLRMQLTNVWIILSIMKTKSICWCGGKGMAGEMAVNFLQTGLHCWLHILPLFPLSIWQY